MAWKELPNFLFYLIGIILFIAVIIGVYAALHPDITVGWVTGLVKFLFNKLTLLSW